MAHAAKNDPPAPNGRPARHDLEALERAHVEQLARANAALAAAQERSYWLDRWHLDLNALMRRRGAAEFRARCCAAVRTPVRLRAACARRARCVG